MSRITRWMWPVLLVTFAAAGAFAQATDLPSVSGFEGALPAYWTMGGQPAGATLSWATDQSRSLGHSLKITKTATADTASWISTNMCDIWSPNVPKAVDILLGAFVMTSGVNTNPATNDARWYVAYDFYDTLGVFIGETKLNVNQATASSSGWVADTNVAAQTVLPRDAYRVIVKFVGGKNATGTVWADDFVFYGRAGQWAGQDWNTSVGVPTGWYYWLPPNGGNDGLLANGFENTVVTSESTHTGTNALKFNLPPGRAVHDGFVGTQRIAFSNLGAGASVNAGDWVRISVWIKAHGLFPDSAAVYPGTWAVGFTPLFFAQAGNNAGYNPVGPQNDYTFAFPSVTAFDWTQYTLDVQLPTGVSAKYLETRLHVYNQFVGTVYFDDLSVTKIDMPQVAAVGGFEGSLPAYWTMGGQPAGATLSWATDQSRSLGHSLKITKTATADTASWISTNMCDIWSPSVPKAVDILLGAFVMTSGVNTNPATNDARWYVAYDFYDTLGVFIGETKLNVNQTTASSSGWVADTNVAAQTVLPRDAYRVIVKFVGGKNATGTVWADDFVFYGRAGQWAGQDWNTSVGVPTGWYYWLPPNGGNDGLLANGFENTRVTTAAAHTGTHSLMLNLPPGRAVHDGFVGTQRFAFSGGGWGTNGPMGGTGASPVSGGDRPFSVNALPGDWVRISVWIKASGLFPDSAAVYPGTWAVGFTPLFFAQAGNNAGYNPVGPQNDYTFAFPSVTTFDWTQYTLDVQIPTAVGTQYMEVRLHAYNQFVGTVYFDDLDVQKIDMPQVAAVGGFEGTLPAYWTMGGQPAGATLSWATDQFRSLGHSLKITKTATSDSAAWISTNMCDIWSPSVPKAVDILLGAYVKTSGVNTNPATNDARWYVAYDFYDTLGVFIGETKLPVNQTSASTIFFVADTNVAAQTVLPRDAYKVIVKFVGGKNATGTVWADDFVFYGRAGQWAGQDWNTSVGVPTGWYYWLPPNGGNDGLLANGFENTAVTTAFAHTGTHSLVMNLPAGRAVHDGFVGTQRFNFTGTQWGGVGPAGNTPAGNNPFGITAQPGDILELSVWIKATGLFPDSEAVYPGTWAVGFTPLFFTGAGNNFGYNPVGPQNDYTFLFPKVASFDWTQYKLNVVVPMSVGATSMEVRLHAYNQFVGTVYFDDLTVRVSGTTLPPTGVNANNSGLPKTFELQPNYPNPFNPSTTIQFGVPRNADVSLVIYNLLGQRVRTLVDHEQRSAGRYSVVWDGRDGGGNTVGSGMYFYRLETGQIALVKKMLMLK